VSAGVAAVEVAAAEPADAGELARLSTQLGYPMTEAEALERLGMLRGHPDHLLLVARRDGRAAGWLQVSRTRIFETPDSAEIAGLVVDEAERGRGIGPMLLRAAEEWARRSGCAALRVRSNVVRERAHGFYRREGYRDVKKQCVFEKELGRDST
jgi:GNAT superfamily N-acetyltransferase